ncbi:MAG TPA: PRC-barrel domain-containing protein [Alphaproteobacteria bacterium]|nr:PRC-barrel domain-containing protein [Alphaproteobacteria bacterium]
MTESTITMEKDHDLIASSRVEGTPVFGQDGEKLGAVKDIILNKKTGKVAYTIMSFGGFLGLGELYHPLPWDVLDYDPEKHGFVVNIDKEVLRNAPTYGPEEVHRLSDRVFLGGIFDYYGIAPYWL